MNDDQNVDNRIVQVTSHTISFGGTVILVRNIARLRSYSVKRNPKDGYAKFGIAVILFIGSIIAFNKQPSLVVWLLIAASFFIFLGFRAINFRRYGLSIETNGGTSDFIVSKKKSFASDVLILIQQTIEDTTSKKSFVINMDNTTIKEGDRFENISGNVKIATRDSTIGE